VRARRPRGRAGTRHPGKATTEQKDPGALDREAVGAAGARLRARREQAGLSLRQFARSVGVSPSFLSQVENGKTQPSVATLYAICHALDLSLDRLFAAEEEPQPAPARPAAGASPETREHRHPAPAPVGRPGKRAVLVLDSGVSWERLAAPLEPGLDFILVRYEPGGCSTPDGRLMRHMGTEYGYVLSGVLAVTLAFETYYLEPGDSISFDSSTPHRLAAVGDDPVEALWFVHGRNSAHDH
jgi:transcriptional regulator with XRE-family HTH domain